MSYESPTLYGYDSKGKLKVWSVKSEGAEVTVSHGMMGGKITSKTTVSKAKNTGRANETTPEQQAAFEAEAKYKKQLKKDYAHSVEDIPESTLPNLAHKWQDKKHTINWSEGVDCLPKLDGVRCTIFLKGGEVFFQSRGGEQYPTIQEIADEALTYFLHSDTIKVDGEFYCHDMHLEDITSAVKKHNEDTPRIQFAVFDLIDDSKPEQTWKERRQNYKAAFATNPMKRMYGVVTYVVTSEFEVETYHNDWVEQGFEGAVIRPHKGLNKFGQRTVDFLKYKVRKDEEFEVVRFEVDKNGCAVPFCKVKNAEGMWTDFKAPLTGTHERNQALYNEIVENGFIIPDQYRWLKVEFEAYSKYGIPAKPKGVAFRSCDENGNPVE